jgi:hypothetical protein
MAKNDPVSLRLRDHAEVRQQMGILKAWDRTVTASQIVKMSTLLVTTAGIVLTALSAGNPVVLANATAYLIGASAPPDGTQSMPTIQLTPDAQTLLPTATEIRQPPVQALLRQFQAWAAEETREEITGALKPADPNQIETRQPPAEVLLKQFQAWAAEEATRDEITGAIEPADQRQTEIRQPPAEALLKQFQAWAAEKAAKAEVRPVKNANEHVRSEHHVRVKIRPPRNARAQLRREHNERVHVRPVKNARATVRQEQNYQPPDQFAQPVQASWPDRKSGWFD